MEDQINRLTAALVALTTKVDALLVAAAPKPAVPAPATPALDAAIASVDAESAKVDAALAALAPVAVPAA